MRSVRQTARGVFRITALALPLLLPSTSAAQQGDAEPTREAEFGALVGPQIKILRIDGSTSALVGGWAGLLLRQRVTLLGGGVASAQKIDLRNGFQLGLGYAGILGIVTLYTRGRISLGSGLMLGVGNADLSDPITRVDLASDNFFIAEPTIVLTLGLAKILRGTAAVAYRIPGGVEDLSGVGASTLRGLSLDLSLQLGRFR